jgi:uncharacterized protein (UPF0333 family)
LKRGQTSIEFIIIILIVVLFVITTTKPLIENAKGITEDIVNITRANSETKRIANAATEISLMGVSSKKTIEVSIPAKATLHCYQDKNVGFTVELQVPPYPKDCNNGICDKNILTPTSFNGSSPISCNSQFENIKGQKTIVIEKDDESKISIHP